MVSIIAEFPTPAWGRRSRLIVHSVGADQFRERGQAGNLARAIEKAVTDESSRERQADLRKL
jgi:hypothetical protein